MATFASRELLLSEFLFISVEVPASFADQLLSLMLHLKKYLMLHLELHLMLC